MADLPPMQAPSIPATPEKHGLGDMLHGKKPIAPAGPNILEVSNSVTDIQRRMRVLEERFLNIRNKSQVIEQNMIHHNKQLFTEIRTTNSDMHDLKREFDDIKTKILLIIKELKSLAKKEDVDVLNKYINMWEPVNFVTRKEVEKMIDERLHELLSKK